VGGNLDEDTYYRGRSSSRCWSLIKWTELAPARASDDSRKHPLAHSHHSYALRSSSTTVHPKRPLRAPPTGKKSEPLAYSWLYGSIFRTTNDAGEQRRQGDKLLRYARCPPFRFDAEFLQVSSRISKNNYGCRWTDELQLLAGCAKVRVNVFIFPQDLREAIDGY